MNDFGFYLVMTNPVVGYVKCAEAAVKAGVKMIQLRMEHASRKKLQEAIGIGGWLTIRLKLYILVN